MNIVSVKEAVFPFPLVQLRYGRMGVGGFKKLSFNLNKGGNRYYEKTIQILPACPIPLENVLLVGV